MFAPDGAGSTADSALDAVRDHPAAAERDRQPPPRPRPADHGRGPDDPARPDARPPGAVPARPRPRQHRRPVRPRRDPRPRGREPRHAWAGSATSSGCAASSTRRGPRSWRSSGGSAAAATGAGSGSRWTRCQRARRAGRVRAPVPRRPRVSHRGARQLVPGLPHERQRPRGHPHPRDRHASGRSATTCSDATTGAPDPDATVTVATTRPETILGDTAVAVHPDDPRYANLVGRRVRIPFVDRDVPVIADPVVDLAFGTGRGQDHAGPRPRRLRDGPPPRPADDHRPRRRRPDRRHRHRLRRPRPLRRARPDPGRPRRPGRPRGRAGARDGHRPLPAQRRRGRAAAQDAVVRPDRPARRAAALDATRGGETPILPDALREGLGALADQHPRLERVAPAVVGPPDPGLVLPGRPRRRSPPTRPARRRARCAAGRRAS